MLDAKPIDGVKNIIAVCSGKGGVGKSTVSVNLAVSLASFGAKVGILDADITAPNIPLMLGIKNPPELSADNKKIMPMLAHGIKIISMGMLAEADQPIIWRGPMMHKVINQFFRDVDWGELDYLIIDLPPGTGDAQISICQSVPLSGVILVSTPQDVAILDSRKSLAMFEKMEVPILGLVENMSYFIAPDTGKRYDIFGHGGAEKVAKELNIEFLGGVPLEINIREGGDSGEPLVSQKGTSEASRVFMMISQKITQKINASQPSEAKVPDSSSQSHSHSCSGSRTCSSCSCSSLLNNKNKTDEEV